MHDAGLLWRMRRKKGQLMMLAFFEDSVPQGPADAHDAGWFGLADAARKG